MLFENFNIRSSAADSKLFFNRQFQQQVDYAIQLLLDEQPLEWQPTTIWIDGNTLHAWDDADRATTERTALIQ